MASLNLDTLPSAVPSMLRPLEPFESNDHFQQMLSIDSALEVVSMSKKILTDKLQARAVTKELTLNAQAAAEHDDIPKSLADLNILQKTFEELQLAARHRFELHARSLRQGKTDILDLPNEVLLMIFGNLRNPLDLSATHPKVSDKEADIEAIKSVRLTCLRFRQNSSHLLIRRLDISANIVPLNHLERVSKHPEISRGERILRVDLRYYSATMARDLQVFSAMCLQRLQHVVNSLSWRIRDTERYGEKSQYLPKSMSLETAKDSLLKLHRILVNWESFSSGIPIEESARFNAATLALRTGHERYRELFQQQERILKDGNFARAVAAAAAASNSKVWLFMSDAEISPSSGEIIDNEKQFETSDLVLFANPDRLEFVMSYMVRPQQWWCARSTTAAQVPQSLLYEIPLAMRTAEAKLAGFKVDINYPYGLNLKMSQEQLYGLTEVTKDLETFSFIVKRCRKSMIEPVPSPEDLQNLYAYFRAAMGPRIVPNLCLELANELGGPDGSRYPFEPLLRSSSWHGLKSATLAHFDMSFQDVRNLIDMLEPGTQLHFVDINLTSGTWAAALDCLRSKASRDSELYGPRGAECDLMSEGEYEHAFEEQVNPCGRSAEHSEATKYITSVEGVENPLRKNDEATETGMQI